nr:hypothetical protein CFP56_56797 [Quercus suber]
MRSDEIRSKSPSESKNLRPGMQTEDVRSGGSRSLSEEHVLGEGKDIGMTEPNELHQLSRWDSDSVMEIEKLSDFEVRNKQSVTKADIVRELSKGNQDIQSSVGRADGPKSEEQDAFSPKKNNHEDIYNEAAKYDRARPINRKKSAVQLKKIAREVGKAQDAEMDILPAKVPFLTPCNMLRFDGQQVSIGRHVPRGRQGPSGRQVPNGRQVPSLTLRVMIHPDGRYISMGRQAPRGHQVPFLTLLDTLRPDGHHVTVGYHIPRGRQVPNGCQVSSLTPRDTFHPDGRHVSIGRQVLRGR